MRYCLDTDSTRIACGISCLRKIGRDHFFYEIAERVRRFPTQNATRFGRIADQLIDFRGPIVALVDFDELVVIEIGFRKRDLAEFANAVRLARRDYEVVG